MRPLLKSKYVSALWPFFLFVIIFAVIFYKVFFYGLVPFPGDLLVSWFFPYNSGGWDGYSSWITRKEFIAADVVRQLYPWRILAMDLLKSGIVPLWNPYAFSGTPLLANIQSAVLYPFNVLFFLFSERTGWVTYIMLQPLLLWGGMYLFVRSLNMSKLSAFFAGLGYAFMGYSIIWLELGIIGHTAAWIPFALYSITQWFATRNVRFLVLTIAVLTFMLLAGHIQTAVYGLLFVAFYTLFVLPKPFLQKLFTLLGIFAFAFGLAAIQLIPSVELLQHAARNSHESKEVFHMFQVPVQHLLTLFVPDFFGNPATNNFWGVNYIEFVLFVGIPTLLFAVIGMFTSKHDRFVRMLLGTIIVSILFAMPTPFSDALNTLQIPVLGTSLPSRALFLTQISFVLLSAFGIEAYLKRHKRIVLPAIFLGTLYGLLWIGVFLLSVFFATAEMRGQLGIAMRNMLVPTGIGGSVFLFIIAGKYLTKWHTLFLIPIIMLTGFEYWYMANKFLPFSPHTYMYPKHELVTKVQELSQYDRIYGFYTARIETNLPTMWRVQSSEGYDPLYIRRYGELIASEKESAYTQVVPRSDAQLTESKPDAMSFQKAQVLNLTGVKYIVDKSDPDLTYPTERFQKVWEKGKWRIYENSHVLPRAAVYYNTEQVTEERDILRTLYDKNFSIRDSVLVEKNGPALSGTSSATLGTITSYTADKVAISVDTVADGVLMLTDSYYPGWEVFVNGTKQELIRVNYTFRGVLVTKGNNTIIFVYRPKSFMIGSAVSGLSLLLLTGSTLAYNTRRKRKP